MAGAAWYQAYLESEHWQQVRERKLEEQDWQCERCGHFARRDENGERLGIEVHHITYERIGGEELSDLEVLCRTCHEEQHGIEGLGRERSRARLTNGINDRLGFDFEPDETELIAMGLLSEENRS